MTITASMIKELRERTGVGMSQCKKALEETKGDLEAAVAHLRKSGMASAVKKEGRTTNEGMIGIHETPTHVAIVEVNAETDFVAKNERFQQFLKEVAQEIAETNPATLEAFNAQKFSKDNSLTIDEYRAVIIQTIGENIQIRRLQTYAKGDQKTVGVYSHMGGKIVSVVEIEGSGDEGSLAREIAMHIAAAHPEYLSPETIPENIVSHEKEIAMGQIANKPDNIKEKIVQGKLNAFFDQACLLRQKFIKDDKVSIENLVSQRAKETGKPLQVTGFARWSVGN